MLEHRVSLQVLSLWWSYCLFTEPICVNAGLRLVISPPQFYDPHFCGFTIKMMSANTYQHESSWKQSAYVADTIGTHGGAARASERAAGASAWIKPMRFFLFYGDFAGQQHDIKWQFGVCIFCPKDTSALTFKKIVIFVFSVHLSLSF